jgi:hypothetical protein
MDNFLLQAVAEAAGTRIAFSNGWRYGAPIPPGPVTVNDLWNIVPPNPPVSTVELTGQEMWDMIEDNLEHTLAADPYQQMGGYVKRCLGLTLYVKFENPAGSRIQQCFIGSEELKRDGILHGGLRDDSRRAERYGRNRRDLELQAIDALKRYCAAHPCVNADLRGTVIASTFEDALIRPRQIKKPMHPMNQNPLLKGMIEENSTGIGEISDEMLAERAKELALIAGRPVIRQDSEQALRELTGGDGMDPRQALFESFSEDVAGTRFRARPDIRPQKASAKPRMIKCYRRPLPQGRRVSPNHESP